MTGIANLVAALGGAGVVFAGLAKLAASIVNVIIASRDLKAAVTENTEATKSLSKRFTGALDTLANHEQRILKLEGKTPNG